MRVEQTIIGNLISNEEYTRRVLPFIELEYFQSNIEKTLFSKIKHFVEKYNSLPTHKTLLLEIESDTTITEGEYSEVQKYSFDLDEEKKDLGWLVDQTEKFCQERSVFNAIMDSIGIIEGRDKFRDKGAIPELLSKALSVSFDSTVGHDFLSDWENRYDLYHVKEDRIPFDIDMLNVVTNGGLVRKTLNVFLAGTGVGKTLTMSHMAAANLMDGKNVLYITMEMSETKIAERIDANLMNVPIQELQDLTRDQYEEKIAKVKSKTMGRLVVKEYPTASVGANHFRFLLNELKLKKNFVPDVLYIDYLNICASSRLKMNASVGSYTYVKAIAEEIRGLAVQFNVPIVTATQVNRSGYQNSDPEITDTAESWGLPATADLMLAIIANESLEALQQIIFKQLKNRYNDVFKHKTFVVGIDRPKMRLYNVEQSAQNKLTNSDPSANSSGADWQKPKSEKRDFGSLFS